MIKIKLEDFLENDGRGARPIPDKTVIDFINKSVNPKYLYDEKILPRFLNAYYEWVQNSNLNMLCGLEKFPALDYMHGVSQAFDFFYLANHNRRFRCFRGDFAYHKVSWKLHFNWEYLDDYPIEENDAVVISVPFSDYGSVHPDTQKILDECTRLNVPVFIDAAYYCIARGVNFNVDQPCIDTVAFSMSKAFYGVDRLRVGMRCRRVREDDGGVIFNDFHMVSRISAGVGLELCNNFNIDYTTLKFITKQAEICKELNIQPSNCIIFGLADENHPKYKDFDRGTDWRRVCISNLIGNCNEIEIRD